MLDTIEAHLDRNEAIDRGMAAWLFEHGSDADLRRLSSQVRDRFHAPDVATYLIMAIVNYTNVCVAKCDYCAFYELPGAPKGYTLSIQQVFDKIDALRGHGGTLISFNGGFHPKLRIHDYAALFKAVRQRYPDCEFFEFTVAEFMFSCKVSKVSYATGAALLAESGTRWVTGGGAEILQDDFRRRHSPLKYKVEDYYDAQKALLDAGIGSTATMVIGFDESLEERLDHLERLRTFQSDTNGGLASFLCWTYKPYNTDLGGSEVSQQEYLRWLAVCRIFLHNFRHIRTSVLTRNEGALLGLQYGANDFDLPTEDEVTQLAGATISHEFEAILDAARGIGFTPTHREPLPIKVSLENRQTAATQTAEV